MRQTLEREYGVDTRQAYAVSEPGGAIAYECCEKNGLHFMDEYIIELCDTATGRQLGPGEVGEIVVTPIHNPTWGLVRFGTGDLSSYTTGACPCGRTAHRLTGIVGRVGDAVKVRGVFVVGKQVEGVFTAFKEIARAQIVVERPAERDEMTFRVELRDEGCDRTALSEELGKRFQAVCLLHPDRIEFVAAGAIPEGAKLITDLRKWG